jgi:hypothetical protein
MLKLSYSENPWNGDTFELNMSFDTLRDYQWERMLKALWAYTGISGPYESKYIPGKDEPNKIKVATPEPTATLSQYAAFEIAPEVKVGVEILITRSLFECVSLAIPVDMFEAGTDLAPLQQAYYDMALSIYETTTYTIAAIGLNRGCQLLMEMMAYPDTKSQFLKMGNFLARDDALAELKLSPQAYKEVKPSLRWYPPRN